MIKHWLAFSICFFNGLAVAFGADPNLSSCMKDLEGTQKKARELLGVADCGVASLYECGSIRFGAAFLAGHAAVAGRTAGLRISLMSVKCNVGFAQLPPSFTDLIVPNAVAAQTCVPKNEFRSKLLEALRSLDRGIDETINKAGEYWLNNSTNQNQKIIVKTAREAMKKFGMGSFAADETHEKLWGTRRDPSTGVFSQHIGKQGFPNTIEDFKRQLAYRDIVHAIVNPKTYQLDPDRTKRSYVKAKWSFLSDPQKDFYDSSVREGLKVKREALSYIEDLVAIGSADKSDYRVWQQALKFLDYNSDSLDEKERALVKELLGNFNKNFAHLCETSHWLPQSLLPHAYAASGCRVTPTAMKQKPGTKFRFSKLAAKTAGLLLRGPAGLFLGLLGVETTEGCEFSTNEDWMPLDVANNCRPIITPYYPPFYDLLRSISESENKENMRSALNRYDPDLCRAINEIHAGQFKPLDGLQCAKSSPGRPGSDKSIYFKEGTNHYYVEHDDFAVRSVRFYEGPRLAYIATYDPLGHIKKAEVYRHKTANMFGGFTTKSVTGKPDTVYSYRDNQPDNQNSEEAWRLLSRVAFTSNNLARAIQVCANGGTNTPAGPLPANDVGDPTRSSP